MTIVQFHLIQSMPPNLVNRDDNGHQKTTWFGGVLRARVSSQAWKSAIRSHPVWGDLSLGTRSRRYVAVLAELLKDKSEDESVRMGAAGVGLMALSPLAKTGDALTTNVFITPEEVQEIADILKANWDIVLECVPPQQKEGETDTAFEKRVKAAKKNADDFAKKVLKVLKDRFAGRTSAADLALFGRMLASATPLSMDAAVTVNHALSTNKVQQDVDFFVGMDDLPGDDGRLVASMLDYTDFSSSVLYRYLTVDMDQLASNLGGDEAQAKIVLERFMTAMMHAVPDGKQTAFADSRSLPDVMLAEVRKDNFAYSLANAFETPVTARGQGLTIPTAEALDAYWSDQLRMWERPASVTVMLKSNKVPDAAMPNLAAKQVDHFSEWMERILAGV